MNSLDGLHISWTITFLWKVEVREKGVTCPLLVTLSSPLLLLKPLFLKAYETWVKTISKDLLMYCSPRGRILTFSARRKEPAVCYCPAGDVAVLNRKICGRAAVITKGHKNWGREELQCPNMVGGGDKMVRYPHPWAGHHGYKGLSMQICPGLCGRSVLLVLPMTGFFLTCA